MRIKGKEIEMEIQKTKSVRKIEEKMTEFDQDSLRFHVLESARNFKTSWLELGQALYSVYKDKMYKQWDYAAFDTYAARELGIRKATAMKLLRSYYFLEKEEPAYLKEGYMESGEVGRLPSYESIDVLRLAKNKKGLDDEDYANFKKEIFQKGKDARQVKRDLTALIRERNEVNPEEAAQKRKITSVKRLLSTLKTLKKEVEVLKLLPSPIIKETASLISKLEQEIL